MYFVEFSDIGFFHPKLVAMMSDLTQEFGHQTITSLYRQDGGVHQSIPLRAVDLRCYNMRVGEEIERWMNVRWVYDPTRLGFDVCLYHDTGHGIHLHLQAHDYTKRRE